MRKHQAFFFVDKRFEISNLHNDIYEIIELSGNLSDYAAY